MKLNWLDRGLVYAPRMVLCLSEQEYLQAVKLYRVDYPHPWILHGQAAVVHTWERDGMLACIVCLNPPEEFDSINVACTIVHEAVHIFQRLCEQLGETSPSKEFQAYSIERITERLMREYARRIKEKA